MQFNAKDNTSYGSYNRFPNACDLKQVGHLFASLIKFLVHLGNYTCHSSHSCSYLLTSIMPRQGRHHESEEIHF